MAIDTQDRRASVLGLGLAALLVLPAPGTIDQPDRQQVAYSYRGIAAESSTTLAPDAIIVTVNAIDRDVVVPSVTRTVTVDAIDRTVVVPNS